jgi:hypothetical protein
MAGVVVGEAAGFHWMSLKTQRKNRQDENGSKNREL